MACREHKVLCYYDIALVKGATEVGVAHERAFVDGKAKRGAARG
jgi:hypothetical protein